MGVLPVQVKELEMAISQQSRCSQYYFGQSVETCGFFHLLVQKFTKISGIYHGSICVYNLFSFPGSFAFGSGLGLEKCNTRNFSI